MSTRKDTVLRLSAAAALLAAAAAPLCSRALDRAVLRTTFAKLAATTAAHACRPAGDLPTRETVFLAGGLAAWQSLGGCGAGASTGSGTGIRWIGRRATGGLVEVQCQTTYTRLFNGPGNPEDHTVTNVLVTRALAERWTAGIYLPLVYKYMRDPFEIGADLSNAGLGDVGALVTRRFGAIGALALTAQVGLPTGQHDAEYRRRILNHLQQRGFGKVTGSLALDHTHDELWGLVHTGANVLWRGGRNSVDSYRAPSASLYGHLGWFVGPFVPSVGLTLTALGGHDRNQTVEQFTGLYVGALNLALEWSNDWVALLVGLTVTYQHDGIYQNTEGQPRSPWGFGAPMAGAGLSFSPF